MALTTVPPVARQVKKHGGNTGSEMRSHIHGATARRQSAATRVSGAVIALSLVFLSIFWVMPTRAEAQTYRFSTVTVQGNSQIDAETIIGFARIAQSRAVSAAELNAAYQRVVATGFFRNVDFAPSGNRLVISVQEYPLLNQVAIEGNRRLRDEQLREVIRSRPGGVFSPSLAESDANAIAEAYAAAGRLSARVTPRLIERPNGRVDLAFEVREGRVLEIQRISFVGNRSFSDRRLRGAVEAAQTGRLSAFFQVDNFNEARIARGRQTLQDFYLSRGFLDAQVTAATTELTRQRDGAFVTYTIREGQQYRFGRQTVISELPGIDAAAYEAAMSNRSGTLFTPNALESLIQQIERIGYQSGERFVRAEPRLTRNERDGTIDVVFALVRGPRLFIERIDIQGNESTQDEVIRRQFQVAEGDPLNPREIREAAARIEALGYFSDVRVNPAQGSSPDQAVVDVQVEETTTGSLGFGLSFGANDGIGASLTYSEQNFLGRGQQLSATFSTIRTARSVDLSFTEPALLGRDLAFGLRLGLSNSTPSTAAQFGTSVLQVTPSLTFPLSEFGRLSVRTSLMRDELTLLPPPGPTGEPPVPTPDPLAPRLRQDGNVGRVVTGSVGVTYTYDTRRIGPDPDRGYVLRFSTDVAGGDRQWMRGTVLAGYEHRVMNGDVTLSAQFEAGMIVHRGGPSRITERFALSSDQFRGFRPYGIGPVGYGADGSRHGLGGNMFAVARLDATFPLGLPQEYNMRGGVFFDVGTVRGIDAPTADVRDTGSIRATAGVALLWDSPFGPLRFNFATPLRREPFDRPQRFDLSIASRF
jgi:outer membrane protein insertion porin family